MNQPHPLPVGTPVVLLPYPETSLHRYGVIAGVVDAPPWRHYLVERDSDGRKLDLDPLEVEPRDTTWGVS
jgi:hypothetical protein